MPNITTPTLPILPLPHPLLILPGARLSLPIGADVGHQLAKLIREADDSLIVAAVPIVKTNSAVENNAKTEQYALGEWGCATRVTRLVRALNASEKFIITVQGLARVRLPKPILLTEDTLHTLPAHSVELISDEGLPRRETITEFRTAALKLVDRLIQDTSKGSVRRDVLERFATMAEDLTESRIAWLADLMVHTIVPDYADRLEYLSTPLPEDRVKKAAQLFTKHASITEVSKKIIKAVDDSLSKQQKEFFLRQQLIAIQRELANLQRNKNQALGAGTGAGAGGDSLGDFEGDEGNAEDDLAEIRRRIEAMERNTDERKMAVREWRRLKRIPQQSAEYGVLRNYLEWLTDLPWASTNNVELSKSAEVLKDPGFLKRAREQLDADHYGLDKIKRRLIEYLAIARLKHLAAEKELKELADAEGRNGSGHADASESTSLSDLQTSDAQKKHNVSPSSTSKQKPAKPRSSVKGPILLLVGPPGTGKTSLGQSIAHALKRPFQRISLGGVRDEAEIRGHRRTYVASGPGVFVQALKKAGRLDPVILLDEIDKVGQSNFHGDVGAALLEVLDPEQNHAFNDHYINVPIDLSQVLFICTANTLDTISAPLLDRCEAVHLAGYTHNEKLHIARRFLLPKQIAANALPTEKLDFTEDALRAVATKWTREAGVRSLERAVGAVVRTKALQWAESQEQGTGQVVSADVNKQGVYNPTVAEADLEEILGPSRWDGDEREREERRGVVYGLVVMGQGEGGILPVESIAIPGTGRLKLTGSLGDVIKESGELALSWVKTHAFALQITERPAQDPLHVPEAIDIHLHLPAGAQKKDGPSAGVAMTCAFVSLLTGATVPINVAMTGEITLRGRVTPVGGIKEKVLGAHRANITKVILPAANRKDVELDVPREIRADMEFAYVRTITEALEAAFGKGSLPWRANLDHHSLGGVLVESRL